MQIFESITYTLVILIATFFLTACSHAVRNLLRSRSGKHSKALSKIFLISRIQRLVFPGKEAEALNFTALLATNIARFCLAISQVFLLEDLTGASLDDDWWDILITKSFGLGFVLLLIVSVVIGDLIPRAIGARYPTQVLRYCAPVATVALIAILPLTYLFYRLPFTSIRASYFDAVSERGPVGKEQLIELLREVAQFTNMDPTDRKLIESVATFRDRIVREVMVPRVELTALSADTSIHEAAKVIKEEGYSRIPIYKENIDNVIGILMTKDLLTKYMEHEQKGEGSKVLQAPVSALVKTAIYTPETKRISHLLQEFRNRQMHLAIVVDEYGGTEGIVTIEDILEQLVGEIADEYDDEEALFVAQSEGRWVVDAKMNLLDVEEQLGLKIPQEGDYDTVGGYIFHRVGTIPKKGLVIHHDNFEMEILSSNDRCVEKVKVKLLTPIEPVEEEVPTTQD